jgi:hypothetical protein
MMTVMLLLLVLLLMTMTTMMMTSTSPRCGPRKAGPKGPHSFTFDRFSNHKGCLKRDPKKIKLRVPSSPKVATMTLTM